MAFDEALLRTSLEAIFPRPTPDEAIAVIDAVRLSAASDGRSTSGELVLLVTLQKLLAEMAGVEELPLSAARVEQRRVFELAAQLGPTGARELAFACAYLVMAQDLEITDEERSLATSLGVALALEPERIAQLASEMAALARTLRA